MMKKYLLATLFFINQALALPNGFVYLKDVDPTIIQDMRYYTSNNFIGRPIKGYDAPQCILTLPAAVALSQVQQQLRSQSRSIKVYDCYRPQQAVDHFVAWSKNPHDQQMKQEYYPHVRKEEVFQLGYVAAKSGHSRGSTVDMTIVSQGHEMDMGTHFDFLDPASHPDSQLVQESAHENRLWLQQTMVATGFVPLSTEWWHFTLKDEPYPDTYYNFTVK